MYKNYEDKLNTILSNAKGEKVEKVELALLDDLENSLESLEGIIKAGKLMEENANQILDFTREVKNMDENKKIQIIETLWQIIYSNKEADIYETNLMRRLAGLLYVDNKTMGDIKEKIKKENS